MKSIPDDAAMIKDLADQAGLVIGDEHVALLARYAALVRDWNERINLISRKDIGNLVPNHIIDSLLAIPLLCSSIEQRTANSQQRLMDIGPGGGFPGIPLKICLPQLALTMVEATQKKAKFIELAVQELGSTNVTVLAKHSRDLLKDPAQLGKYDFVTARAVSELKDLVKDSFPFLRPSGALLAYKSARADEEIAAADAVIRKLGGTVEAAAHSIPAAGGKDRRIVVVRKGSR